VFELDDEDKAVVIDPNGASRDDLIAAAWNCPVTAITIREASSGEQLVP
jgi:ferredoxin